MIPQKLILHCSATPDGASYSWDAIRRYHIESKGWSDIGYHFGLEYLGDEIIVMRGRSPWEMGAHCKAAGRNRDSIGVCVVGEFDAAPPDALQYVATIALLAQLCWVLNIPASEVYGHREFESAKTCPGLKWDLDAVRADVAARLQEPVSAPVYAQEI